MLLVLSQVMEESDVFFGSGTMYCTKYFLSILVGILVSTDAYLVERRR